ncbi:hypothetical protein AMATHDRAFT_77287 [Amanita thiersii Skay4041]|uniref:Major facilitator superfamily (MFS) profile domain-containing protein n=1 Tax=Amanita thiersii Skay4041 TaxID=703135 RepID=A0A2A9NHK3_9AGAR|nr:hypothetical protein AMATHDRAFT_77287 [Amanita thiersii Skay4041]
MPSRNDTLDTLSVEAKLSTQHEKDPDSEFGGTDARKALERRLLLKIDLRMSVLVVIYILNYIDRTTASNARLKDFEADLGLKGQQFATLLSILYVGYTLMQIPSNMFMNYIGRPSIYLCICMMLWGLVTCLTAYSFVGALLAQFFLGFIQAAFFPGALFLLTKWYKQKELGLRTAMLFCGNTISVAFGALIASGILDSFEGKLGHAGWRWLFFIEGALTVFVALAAVFILPDFPATDRYLTPQERALAIRRMEEDIGVAEGVDRNTNGLWLAVTDWKVWWLASILALQNTSLSFGAYFPTITATLGYNPTISLLLVAPPFVLTTLISFLISWHSDKVGERFYHITFSIALGIVGFIISISTMQIVARYVAMFFITQSFAGLIVFLTWISNSISQPPSKRAVALALTNAFGQLGNVAGSYVWPKEWGPTYRNSYIICIVASSLCLAMCWWFRRCLILLNSELEKAGEGKFENVTRYML